jgi:[ribosomal protein S5]-alanine N-acetyltransferase
MAPMSPQLGLIPPLPEHVTRWWRWRQQPQARKVMPLTDATEAELLGRLQQTSADVTDRAATGYRRMVQLNGSEIIGTVSARHPEWPAATLEIGYMLDEEHHGRGLGKRMVGLWIDELLRTGKFERLWLLTNATNEPSQRLALRLGFQLEGRLREHVLLNGKRADQLLYGLLRAEWGGM